MQQRNKNRIEKQNLKNGDLVYLNDDDNPLISWPLGIVENVYAGKDSLCNIRPEVHTDGKYS